MECEYLTAIFYEPLVIVIGTVSNPTRASEHQLGQVSTCPPKVRMTRKTFCWNLEHEPLLEPEWWWVPYRLHHYHQCICGCLLRQEIVYISQNNNILFSDGSWAKSMNRAWTWFHFSTFAWNVKSVNDNFPHLSLSCVKKLVIFSVISCEIAEIT